VVVTPDTIQVTFDSDLDPGTIAGGIVVLDAKGKQIDTSQTYSNKTVTISGLALKPGAYYRIVVLTTVRDVLGHNVAAEYDLDLVGPVAVNQGDGKTSGSPTTGSPSPNPSPNPSPSPTPASTPAG